MSSLYGLIMAKTTPDEMDQLALTYKLISVEDTRFLYGFNYKDEGGNFGFAHLDYQAAPDEVPTLYMILQQNLEKITAWEYERWSVWATDYLIGYRQDTPGGESWYHLSEIEDAWNAQQEQISALQDLFRGDFEDFYMATREVSEEEARLEYLEWLRDELKRTP